MMPQGQGFGPGPPEASAVPITRTTGDEFQYQLAQHFRGEQRHYEERLLLCRQQVSDQQSRMEEHELALSMFGYAMLSERRVRVLVEG